MPRKEWRRRRIAELQADKKWALNGGPFGSKLVGRDYTEIGVPVIRGSNLPFNRRFSFDGFVFVSESKADELLANNAHPGDVVFTQRGTLGQVGLIPANSPYARYVISQSQMKLTVDDKKCDPAWVYYCFRSPDVFQSIVSLASSSGVPHINLAALRDFEVDVPSLKEQRCVASVLSAYDDLIENNTRRIAILEEMAWRLYEEWFVHFRFPGHEQVRMVESELGLIPEGWEVRGLYDIADLTYGCPLKSGLFNTENRGRGLIRIRDILSDSTSTFTDEDVADRYLVKIGDILIGMDGGFHMGKWAGPQCWLNQRVVRLRPKSGMSRYFLYLATFKPIKHLEATIVGTTVAHLSARDLQEMRLLVADNAVMEKAHEILDPMMNLEISLKRKNANLRAQRDLLLPKLISGEIDVSTFPEADAVAA